MKPFTSIVGALIVMLGLAAVSSPSAADELDQLSQDDRSAIRSVVEGQLAAFQADDAALAFSYATPSIQEQFGDAARFIAMVKHGYAPVYRPREVAFSDILELSGKPAQRVVVVGPDNEVFNAFYLMERQPDGGWRIDGCILRPNRDRAI